MIDSDDRDTGEQRFSVLIAGAGVAGLEAAFALRELAGDRIAVTVLSAGEDFVYRPSSIGEPFDRSYAEHYELVGLATEAGAELVRGTLAHVDTEARLARTVEGGELSYDALLVATGARIEPFSEHTTNVDDAHWTSCSTASCRTSKRAMRTSWRLSYPPRCRGRFPAMSWL